jgi:hypothetical protein
MKRTVLHKCVKWDEENCVTQMHKTKLFIKLEFRLYILTLVKKVNSSPKDYHVFPSLKQNLDRHRFEVAREVETVVTRWLVRQDTD